MNDNPFNQIKLFHTIFKGREDVFAFLGEIISEVESTEIENFKHAQIIVRNTNLDIPFNSKTESFKGGTQFGSLP